MIFTCTYSNITYTTILHFHRCSPNTPTHFTQHQNIPCCDIEGRMMMKKRQKPTVTVLSHLMDVLVVLMVYYFTRDNNVWIHGHTNNMSIKGTTTAINTHTNAINIIITFHQSVHFHTFFTSNLSFITPDGAKCKHEASARSPGGEPGRGGQLAVYTRRQGQWKWK